MGNTETPTKNAPSSKTNPNRIGGDQGEYAGYVSPARPDASLVGGSPGAYYEGDTAQGNVVDRNRIPKTLDQGSRQKTSAKPAGPVTGSGY